jgi:hypothetical protein
MKIKNREKRNMSDQVPNISNNVETSLSSSEFFFHTFLISLLKSFGKFGKKFFLQEVMRVMS